MNGYLVIKYVNTAKTNYLYFIKSYTTKISCTRHGHIVVVRENKLFILFIFNDARALCRIS
jgi:hypothetical protein